MKKNQAAARIVLKTLQKANYQSYIVGGAVRDIMLDKKPDDFDILTNASIKEIRHLFSDQNVNIVGKAFPICMVNGVEVATGRAKFDKESFPESDLAKRDFTINSMAYDPVKQIIIDPFHGRKDLQDGVIRFTKDPDKRIKEDPVRMIRACRFAAMIEGTLSLSSFNAVLANKDLIEESAAKERIHHEIMKSLQLPKPSLFFKALKKNELLSKLFPSIDQCYDLDGGPHHGETVFEHCMLVGDALPANLPILRLAGFLHDAGKFDAAVIKEGQLTFPLHEKYTKNVIRDLTELRFSMKDIAYIESLILSHMRPLKEQTTPKAVRRLLSMLDTYGLDYRDFMRMRIADKKGNLAKQPYTIQQIRFRLKKLFTEMEKQSALNLNHLEITGTDIIKILDIPPGPDVGKIKQMLLEKVLDEPELNNYHELKKICLSLKIKE